LVRIFGRPLWNGGAEHPGYKSVLGIRDILVQIRIPDPVPLTKMDPDPDPTPDPTPFFIDFKDAKNNFFKRIFSFNLPTGTSSSV
jgi:hypothetical protein